MQGLSTNATFNNSHDSDLSTNSTDLLYQRQHNISKMLDRIRQRHKIMRPRRAIPSRRRLSRKSRSAGSVADPSDVRKKRRADKALEITAPPIHLDDESTVAKKLCDRNEMMNDVSSPEEGYESSFIDDSRVENEEAAFTPTSHRKKSKAIAASSDDDSSSSAMAEAQDVAVHNMRDAIGEEQDSHTPDLQESDPILNFEGVLGDNLNPFEEARNVQKEMLCRKNQDNVHLTAVPEFHPNEPPAKFTIAEKWSSYLEGLFQDDPDFLTSDEARMLSDETPRQGVTTYRRLALTESNCADVKEVHRLVFKAKAVQGYSNAGYSHFLTAIGQFARMRCSLEADECEREIMLVELCSEGSLFKLVSSLDHVELFLEYFEARSSSPSTCMGKTAQLLKLASSAKRFYERRGDVSLVADISRVMDKLQSSHSAYKQATRRQSRQRKVINKRKENGILMCPSDFMKCKNIAKEKLSAIMASIRRIKVERSQKEAKLRLIRDESLLSMWCINFLALLMVCCGGQRPQVFCQLQRLSPRQLHEVSNKSTEKKYIELHTVHEKTSRALDMPFVPFPASLLTILKFHQSEILPILDEKRSDLQKLKENEREFAKTCLVLHSKNGVRLATKQITETFRLFLFRVDSKLSRMSTMNLRASYATMMLNAHRQGKIFKDDSEETFLEFLGKAMNTSVEQLKDTYASVFNEDFNSIANAICESLSNVAHEDPASLSYEIHPNDEDSGDVNMVTDDADFF